MAGQNKNPPDSFNETAKLPDIRSEDLLRPSRELIEELQRLVPRTIQDTLVNHTRLAYRSLPSRLKKPLLWERHCLVSVGATTTFTPLVQEIFSDAFIKALVANAYTRLTVQCGGDIATFGPLAAKFIHPALQVDAFDYVDDLTEQMIKLKPNQEITRFAGSMICHAGTGTVLDALRVDIPFIVVPNPELKDNHQVELAEEMEKQKYAVYGKLGNLGQSLAQATNLFEESSNRQTPHTIGPIKDKKGVTIWDAVDAARQVVPPPAGASVTPGRNDVGGASRPSTNAHIAERVARFMEQATDKEREMYTFMAMG